MKENIMLEKVDDENVWDLRFEFLDCRDLEHNPPGYIVLPDGSYKHTCPTCGRVTVFTIKQPTLCVL